MMQLRIERRSKAPIPAPRPITSDLLSSIQDFTSPPIVLALHWPCDLVSVVSTRTRESSFRGKDGRQM